MAQAVLPARQVQNIEHRRTNKLTAPFGQGQEFGGALEFEGDQRGQQQETVADGRPPAGCAPGLGQHRGMTSRRGDCTQSASGPCRLGARFRWRVCDRRGSEMPDPGTAVWRRICASKPVAQSAAKTRASDRRRRRGLSVAGSTHLARPVSEQARADRSAGAVRRVSTRSELGDLTNASDESGARRQSFENGTVGVASVARDDEVTLGRLGPSARWRIDPLCSPKSTQPPAAGGADNALPGCGLAARVPRRGRVSVTARRGVSICLATCRWSAFTNRQNVDCIGSRAMKRN